MKKVFAVVLSALAAGGVSAQGSPQAAMGATAAAFRCGGVGQDEQDRIKAEAAAHDLLLTFATSGGAYLADVDVEIRSGDKLVLQGRCTGPLMLVDLPADGSYEVRASAGGREQVRSVRIGGRAATATFTWP